MADVIGEAIVALRANTSGFLSDISSAVGKANGEMSKLGKVGTIATAGITAPILAIGAFSLEAAKTVDGASTNMVRSMNVTGAEAERMKASFKNVFGNVPESADTVGNSMTIVHNRLGLTGTDLENVTKQGLELSRVLGTSATPTIEGAAKAFEAWHVPTDQMGVDMDKLYVISTKTGVPIDQLTGSLTKSGAIATNAGVSFDVMSAAVGSLGASGIPARQGVTMVQEAIVKLEKGGKNAGVELPKILERIATGTATAADKALLGQKNFDKFSGALRNTRTGYDAMKEGMNDAKGALDDQATKTEKFSEKLAKFKNQLMIAFEPLGKALINLGSSILTMISPVLPVITNLINMFARAPAPVQMLVLAIGGIAAAIGPVLMMVTKLQGAFSTLKSVAGTVGGIGSKLVGALGGGGTKLPSVGGGGKMTLPSITGGGKCPIGPECFDRLVTPAKGVSGEVGKIEKGLEGASNKGGLLSGIFNRLPGPIQGILSKIPGIGGGFKSAEGNAGGLLSKVTGMGGGVTGLLGKLPLVGGLLSGASGSAGGLSGALAAVGTGPLLPAIAIAGAGIGVMALTSGTFRGMLGGAATKMQEVGSWAGKVAGALMSGDFSKVGTLLQQGFQGAIDFLKNTNWGEVGAKLILSIKESLSTIGSVLGPAISGALNFADDILDQISNIDWDSAIQGLIDAILGIFGGGAGGGSATTAASTGMNKGLMQGVTTAAPQILLKLGEVFLKLLAIVPVTFAKIGIALATTLFNALKTIDWGKLFGGVGSAIGKALGGVGGGAAGAVGGAVGGAAKSIWSFITGSAKSVWTFIIVTTKAVWSFITGAAKSIWTFITGAAKSVWDFITGTVKSVWDYFSDTRKAIWDFVLGTTKAIWEFIIQTTKDVWTFIVQTTKDVWTFIVQTTKDVWTFITQSTKDVWSFITTSTKDIWDFITTGTKNIMDFITGSIDIKSLLHLQTGGVVSPQAGGVPVIVAEGGEREAIIPESKFGGISPNVLASLPRMAGGGIVSPSGAISSFRSSSSSMRGGDIVFNITIPNATLTSVQDAEKLGRRIGYQATEMLRRSGHVRG